ncbi:MAG: 3-hydroxyacyl-CoA dehydrogenase [Hyphomicrobiaceae bacterium]
MPFDPDARDLTVAVVGTGTMGRGIVQVAAQGGMRTIAFDERAGAADDAKTYIADMLGKMVAKGRLPDADARAALDRIRVASDLAEVATADVVIEAVVERLDVKQDLFSKLDEVMRPDAILASNTSSLPVTAIAAKCRWPERVGGMHFFNPVPLMRLVEVIPGLKTAPWVADALMAIGRRMGREPVLCKDSPGFLVNHVGRALIPESLHILEEGIASHDEIDRILTGAPGFKIGPFALADMVGLDVGHAVMESLYGQFYFEPRYAPSPLMALRTAGGALGRKTGSGWYQYEDGAQQRSTPPPTPQKLPRSVWVRPSDHHPDLQAPLLDVLRQSGVTLEDGSAPSDDALIILTPIGWDLTTAVCDLKLDPQRTVAVDVLFGMKGPRTLMVTPATSAAARDGAHAVLTSDGQPVVVINDSPGFVAQRIVAQIVNVGCSIAQRGIADPADIDKATKLGLGYPFGPLEWGDRIGPARILHILERLHAFYREPRYRPSSWLRRRAMLGLPLSATDGRQ